MKSLATLGSWFALLLQAFFSILALFTNDVVVTHWNIKGEINGVGEPWSLLLLLLISLIVYFVLTWAENNPRMCNIPKCRRSPGLYKTVEAMIASIKLILMVIFVVLTISSRACSTLCMPLIWVLLGLIILSVVYHSIRLIRE